MKILISNSAKQSLAQSKTFYNSEQAGLGYAFVQEFTIVLETIKENPEAWTPLSKQTRRCLFNRFPYYLIYRYDSKNATIQIIDLMHQKQAPKSFNNL